METRRLTAQPQQTLKPAAPATPKRRNVTVTWRPRGCPPSPPKAGQENRVVVTYRARQTPAPSVQTGAQAAVQAAALRLGALDQQDPNYRERAAGLRHVVLTGRTMAETADATLAAMGRTRPVNLP